MHLSHRVKLPPGGVGPNPSPIRYPLYLRLVEQGLFWSMYTFEVTCLQVHSLHTVLDIYIGGAPF